MRPRRSDSYLNLSIPGGPPADGLPARHVGACQTVAFVSYDRYKAVVFLGAALSEYAKRQADFVAPSRAATSVSVEARLGNLAALTFAATCGTIRPQRPLRASCGENGHALGLQLKCSPSSERCLRHQPNLWPDEGRGVFVDATTLIHFAAEFEFFVFAVTFVVCVCVLSLTAALFVIKTVLAHALPLWRELLHEVAMAIDQARRQRKRSPDESAKLQKERAGAQA